ncbi:TatD DNase family protein [Anaerobacterium chartisolvens]|uniref:TatD DNase family protein n=1 Tax=Anaerobacterium chartisolvens TaxID=1297424 RepID=A0A369B9U4_9FIRM|nr:TatD family hydrolase [Anaerobacterium chartisolvens]RCX18292.1 TatD DNase family protein [Anaerobacterium chartisolvens]
MLFDSHAHYDDLKFDADRNSVIERAREAGVSYILNASSNMSSAVETVSIAQEFDFIYAAVGIHPHNVHEINENILNAIRDFASDHKVVAIGEIGLDYYYDTCPRDLQKHWFARQLGLAKELGLPAIIHDREAHEDTLDIIKSENSKETGGVFHCYSGSVEMARDVLDNNFYISIGGAVTFKNARKAIEVVNYVPMDRLLIETDCPYMTPEPYRGKRNDSGYIGLVAQKIADIKGLTYEQVACATTENAKRLFNINA